MRSLLDVSVLLAILDREHPAHRESRSWLEGHIVDGWASCAITQNGFVRILSRPGYPSTTTPGQALEMLARACATEQHRYVPCDVSILDEELVDRRRLHGPQQLTDVYLLALAVRHDLRLVTLDTHIPLSAVHGATPEHLVAL